MLVSDRQLKTWYCKFNRKYWNGELPEDTILYWEPLSADAGVTCPVFEVADGKFVIKIDPMYSGMKKVWKTILLHEMCHVRLWPNHSRHEHGKIFQQEKDRIYALGALKDLW